MPQGRGFRWLLFGQSRGLLFEQPKWQKSSLHAECFKPSKFHTLKTIRCTIDARESSEIYALQARVRGWAWFKPDSWPSASTKSPWSQSTGRRRQFSNARRSDILNSRKRLILSCRRHGLGSGDTGLVCPSWAAWGGVDSMTFARISRRWALWDKLSPPKEIFICVAYVLSGRRTDFADWLDYTTFEGVHSHSCILGDIGLKGWVV